MRGNVDKIWLPSIKKEKGKKNFVFAALTRGTLGPLPNTALVENRRKTDTAFKIGHAYLKLYPSRVFVFLKHDVYVYTRNQPSAIAKKREKTSN